MTILNNYDYTNLILSFLKQTKRAPLHVLQEKFRVLRDDKKKEKLQAFLDDLISSGKIFTYTDRSGYEFYYHPDHKDLNDRIIACTNEISDENEDDDENEDGEDEDGEDEEDGSDADGDDEDSDDGDVSDGDSSNHNEQVTPEVATPQQQIEKPEYTIDPEFQRMFSEKTAEQYEELKEAISNEGIRDDLVVWEETDILLDGHHRHRICEELGIKPPFCTISLADREQAKMWIVHNQVIRRNLNTFQRVEAALQFKDFFAEKARANQHAGVSPDLGKGIETNEVIAKLAGVKSPETVRKVEKILPKASAEELNALRRDEDGISIHSVYQKYYGEEKSRSKKEPAPVSKTAIDSPSVRNKQDNGKTKATPKQADASPLKNVTEPRTLPMESVELPPTLKEQFKHPFEELDRLWETKTRLKHRVALFKMAVDWTEARRNEVTPPEGE